MSSCLGFRKSKGGDTDPLLPQYETETALQQRVFQKLHSYQMLRALSKGFMPSTDQVIINLRTLLASDLINSNDPALSDSGRRLLKYSKEWLTEFIELLRHKNDADQIQDFIWLLSKSDISLDTADLATKAATVKARANTSAAVESIKTVGSLLFTNSDFRIFLGDLSVIGKQVFSDTAFTFSDAAKQAGEQLKPSGEESELIQKPGEEATKPPTADDFGSEATDVAKVLGNGLQKTGDEALASLKENVTGSQKETLLYRLKAAVLKLRRRPDYTDSVSTITLLLKRYAKVYSTAAEDTVGALQEDVNSNDELDNAAKNLWSLITSFGDRNDWEELEKRFQGLMQHSQKDPNFENLVEDIANSVQKVLTDPDFFDSANEKIVEIREKTKEIGNDSSVKSDSDAFLEQIRKTYQSVLNDHDIAKLISTTLKIFHILSPLHVATNQELINDSIHVFIPLIIQAIQYIPIPRLEVSVPEIDLLLENLILEPGHTVNHSSFLPYKLKVETYNDFELRKAKHTTTTSATSLVTVKLDGLSIRGDDIGFWLRAHSGILRLADEGLASFQLDERGIDIHLDIELGQERLEKMITLRDVRVHIHHLSYTLRKSKFAWAAWLLKPLLRPILRKVLERQLATAISTFLHAANRELLFARERLRATRIADPQDLRTFFKAVMARLTPEPDPDVYTGVGIKASGEGVFAGVYAPGSVVKLWNEEAERAAEVVDDQAELGGGWRNEVFDVHTRMMGQ